MGNECVLTQKCWLLVPVKDRWYEVNRSQGRGGGRDCRKCLEIEVRHQVKIHLLITGLIKYILSYLIIIIFIIFVINIIFMNYHCNIFSFIAFGQKAKSNNSFELELHFSFHISTSFPPLSQSTAAGGTPTHPSICRVPTGHAEATLSCRLFRGVSRNLVCIGNNPAMLVKSYPPFYV